MLYAMLADIHFFFVGPQSFLFRGDHLFGNAMISCQHLGMGYGTHKVQSQEKKEGMSNIFTGSEELRGPGDKREFSWV